MNHVRLKLFTILALFGVFACTNKTVSPSVQNAPKKTVSLAIWSNYVSEEVLKEFENKFNAKVIVSNYSSNEELLAKMQAGASGYDVIVPSDYMAFIMSKQGMLLELNHSLLPQKQQIDARYLGKNFDSTNKYTLPFDWGVTGIAVHTGLLKEEVKSWKQFYENPKLAGKVTLLDDVREVMGSYFKLTGKSLNSKNAQDIQAAKKFIQLKKSNVKEFTSEPIASLTAGEVLASQMYMSDALIAKKKTNGQISFFVPEEGATFYIDNFAIPKTTSHSELAHQLINFLLEEKAHLETVKKVMVGPVLKTVFDGLKVSDPLLFKDLFISDDVFSKLEMMEDVGEAVEVYDRAWTEIKAGE